MYVYNLVFIKLTYTQAVVGFKCQKDTQDAVKF